MDTVIQNTFNKVDALQLCRLSADAYNAKESFPAEWQREDVKTDILVRVYNIGQDFVFAFRGTHSLENFVTDARAIQVPESKCQGCYVHHGFKEALDGVWIDVIEQVTYLNLHWPKARIFLTGHSLGGALAKLSASRLINTVPIAWVCTFGEPRVGNNNFAERYDFWLKSKTFRVVHRDDVVARVPWLLASYRHCGHCAFFDYKNRLTIDLPWWCKTWSGAFGAWEEWWADRRIALLEDHKVEHYITLLSNA